MMIAEHIQSAMPSGVIELCREWFDEPCDLEIAIEVASMSTVAQPYFGESVISGCLVWLKSRLIERGVLRALAIELGRHDDTPRYPPEAPKPSMTDAERSAYLMALKWKAPLHLGHTASRLSRSPLLISPIDRVADRVAHFDNDDRCPYCNRFYRNGAALRLHVIERHLEEAS